MSDTCIEMSRWGGGYGPPPLPNTYTTLDLSRNVPPELAADYARSSMRSGTPLGRLRREKTVTSAPGTLRSCRRAAERVALAAYAWGCVGRSVAHFAGCRDGGKSMTAKRARKKQSGNRVYLFVKL